VGYGWDGSPTGRWLPAGGPGGRSGSYGPTKKGSPRAAVSPAL